MTAKYKYAKSKGRNIFLLAFVAVILVTLPYCGKRGPLKLEPRFIPTAIENFQVSQEGAAIKLKWDFPQYGMVDKKKRSFEPEMIKRLYIYYSNKQIVGGKFKKKSKVLEKLYFTELKAEAPTETQQRQAAAFAKRGSRAQTVPWQHLTYSVKIPFKLTELDNKVHYFAIMYKYNKKKAPLSVVRLLNTRIPVNPVSSVQITRENKVNKITWARPQNDAAGKPVTEISGYNIYRKIEPKEEPTVKSKDEEKKEGTEETQPQQEVKPVFTQLNTDNILEEIYEDDDTGTNGKYYYYVTALMSKDIASTPSPAASVEITDIYPPEIPANLVGFKGKGYMLLMWRAVGDQDLSHYRIYRRTENQEEFKLLADNIEDTTRYQDKRVRLGRKYIYVVTAVDEKGNESAYSNTVEEQY